MGTATSHGVYVVRYNVTSLVTTGTNTATADTGKRKGSFDSRVNATDLNKGTYTATIVINSNDPDEFMVDIPSREPASYYTTTRHFSLTVRPNSNPICEYYKYI